MADERNRSEGVEIVIQSTNGKCYAIVVEGVTLDSIETAMARPAFQVTGRLTVSHPEEINPSVTTMPKETLLIPTGSVLLARPWKRR